MPGFSIRSSGDLLADRRFAYGEACLAEGDGAAARDLFAQVLELAPHWPPAHLKLGLAHQALGETAGARAAFAACLALDRQDILGAGLHLARLDGVALPMSEPYLTALFDDYAPRFDAHLTGALAYRAPALLAEAVARACRLVGRPPRFVSALDLGCGTGLMAEALAARPEIGVADLIGIDLSAGMLEKACATGRYGRLERAEIAGFLAGAPAAAQDLVLAADVFCYVADLAPILAGARRVLASDGLLAFTIQTHPGVAVRIGEDLRIHHPPALVRRLAELSGFRLILEEAASARLDRGQPVPGAIFVLAAA